MKNKTKIMYQCVKSDTRTLEAPEGISEVDRQAWDKRVGDTLIANSTPMFNVK